MAIDPVDSGLVVSLAHPGCNVTGLTIQATDLAGNRRQCDGPIPAQSSTTAVARAEEITLGILCAMT